MNYRLVRDDGQELRVQAGIWELVLELACIYGWKPAGTEEPRTDAWRRMRRREPENAHDSRVWNRSDYFTRQSQHIAPEDARALAEAVFRGLPDIPDRPSSSGQPPDTHRPLSRPSGPAAPALPPVVEELTGQRKSVARRVAVFAEQAGFTIAPALPIHRERRG